MNKFRLRIYLVALFLATIPTVMAYFALKGVLYSSLTLGLDQRIEAQLETAGDHLKKLAKLDRKNESIYESQFQHLQEVKGTYSFLLETLPSMHRIYVITFIIIIGMGLGFALILATWLNHKLIQSHESALNQMKASRDQVFYLENRESWRLVAQKLVHEIKNPLTPIQMMVARLPSKYLSSPTEQEFKRVLDETKQIVTEEIQKVTAWIEAFSKYARMPSPHIVQVEIDQFLEDFQKSYGDYWENLVLSVKSDPGHIGYFDPMLVKQVLFNLAKNSAESDFTRQIEFSIEVQCGPNGITFRTIDNGPGVPEKLKSHLFQPNISTKGTDQPRGFGLAIAKKILIEHGGDIHLRETPSGCEFEIILPQGAPRR